MRVVIDVFDDGKGLVCTVDRRTVDIPAPAAAGYRSKLADELAAEAGNRMRQWNAEVQAATQATEVSHVTFQYRVVRSGKYRTVQYGNSWTLFHYPDASGPFPVATDGGAFDPACIDIEEGYGWGV